MNQKYVCVLCMFVCVKFKVRVYQIQSVKYIFN